MVFSPSAIKTIVKHSTISFKIHETNKEKACGFIYNFNPVSSLPLIASLLGIPHFHDQPHQGAKRSISKQTVLSDNMFSL